MYSRMLKKVAAARPPFTAEKRANLAGGCPPSVPYKPAVIPQMADVAATPFPTVCGAIPLADPLRGGGPPTTPNTFSGL